MCLSITIIPNQRRLPNGPPSNEADKILSDIYRYNNTYAVAACPPTRDLSEAKRDVPVNIDGDAMTSSPLGNRVTPHRGLNRNRYYIVIGVYYVFL